MTRRLRPRRAPRGYILVEVLVASMILAVGVLAVIEGMVMTLRFMAAENLRFAATLELERVLNDDNLIPGIGGSLSGDLSGFSWEINRQALAIERSTSGPNPGPRLDEVTAVIRWIDRGKTREIRGVRLVPASRYRPDREGR